MKKKTDFFPLMMLVLSLVLADKAAHASEGPATFDLMCKNRAKEVALQTYQTCVTEERATRLQDLKSRYKARMSEVKEEFQRELNEINGGKVPANEAPKAKAAPVREAKAKPARPGRAEKPVSGVAKALPMKQNDNGPALPVQAQVDVQTVVAPTVDETATPEPEIVEITE